MSTSSLSTPDGHGLRMATIVSPHVHPEQLAGASSMSAISSVTLDHQSNSALPLDHKNCDGGPMFAVATSEEDMPTTIDVFLAAANVESGGISKVASTHAISDDERFSIRDPADLDEDIEFTELLRRSIPAPRDEAPRLPGTDVLDGEDPVVALLMQDLLGDANAVAELHRQGGLEAQGRLQDLEDAIDVLLEDADAEWLPRRGVQWRGVWARPWRAMDSMSIASTTTPSLLSSEGDDESYMSMSF